MTNILERLHRICVWNKGHKVPGLDPMVWRNDDFGNRIRFADYGDRTCRFGWEKDHITPKAVGGTDELNNLRPLHFRKNASMGGILSQLLDR